MNATILAVLLTLAPGDNPAPEAYGQVAAVQAADGDSIKILIK